MNIPGPYPSFNNDNLTGEYIKTTGTTLLAAKTPQANKSDAKEISTKEFLAHRLGPKFYVTKCSRKIIKRFPTSSKTSLSEIMRNQCAGRISDISGINEMTAEEFLVHPTYSKSFSQLREEKAREEAPKMTLAEFILGETILQCQSNNLDESASNVQLTRCYLTSKIEKKSFANRFEMRKSSRAQKSGTQDSLRTSQFDETRLNRSKIPMNFSGQTSGTRNSLRTSQFDETNRAVQGIIDEDALEDPSHYAQFGSISSTNDPFIYQSSSEDPNNFNQESMELNTDEQYLQDSWKLQSIDNRSAEYEFLGISPQTESSFAKEVVPYDPTAQEHFATTAVRVLATKRNPKIPRISEEPTRKLSTEGRISIGLNTSHVIQEASVSPITNDQFLYQNPSEDPNQESMELNTDHHRWTPQSINNQEHEFLGMSPETATTSSSAMTPRYRDSPTSINDPTAQDKTVPRILPELPASIISLATTPTGNEESKKAGKVLVTKRKPRTPLTAEERSQKNRERKKRKFNSLSIEEKLKFRQKDREDSKQRRVREKRILSIPVEEKTEEEIEEAHNIRMKRAEYYAKARLRLEKRRVKIREAQEMLHNHSEEYTSSTGTDQTSLASGTPLAGQIEKSVAEYNLEENIKQSQRDHIDESALKSGIEGPDSIGLNSSFVDQRASVSPYQSASEDPNYVTQESMELNIDKQYLQDSWKLQSIDNRSAEYALFGMPSGTATSSSSAMTPHYRDSPTSITDLTAQNEKVAIILPDLSATSKIKVAIERNPRIAMTAEERRQRNRENQRRRFNALSIEEQHKFRQRHRDGSKRRRARENKILSIPAQEATKEDIDEAHNIIMKRKGYYVKAKLRLEQRREEEREAQELEMLRQEDLQKQLARVKRNERQRELYNSMPKEKKEILLQKRNERDRARRRRQSGKPEVLSNKSEVHSGVASAKIDEILQLYAAQN